MLRRPGLLQTGDDVPRQVWILVQLASADTPSVRARLGCLRKVAAQPGPVVMPVAPDLAVNGRAIAAEPLGDPRHGHLRFAQLENQLPLIQGEMVVALAHSRIRPRDNPLKSLAGCTWKWNPPPATPIYA
jgi:hypothetical protein